jgi:hypothetical protein
MGPDGGNLPTFGGAGLVSSLPGGNSTTARMVGTVFPTAGASPRRGPPVGVASASGERPS